MTVNALPDRVVGRLYDQALTALPLLEGRLALDLFVQAIDTSVTHRFSSARPTAAEITRYLNSLNARDLALATACLDGNKDAWSHVMMETRPALYRAAGALTKNEASGRELADALWAELYGVGSTKDSIEPGAEKRPLLAYFHGRSTLATWMRAVLAQRHVDTVRQTSRLEPLETGDTGAVRTRAAQPADPDRAGLRRAFEGALEAALRELDSDDRLRIGLYYAQGLRLAGIGRITGEHEATVSRALSRIRRHIRTRVERELSEAYGLDEREIETCYQDTLDQGAFDLTAAVGETTVPE